MANYLQSNLIKVFPTPNRDHSIDPESYLNTEYNLTHLKQLSENIVSYVIEDGDYLIIYLAGYYFKCLKSSVVNLNLNDGDDKTVWAYIKLTSEVIHYTTSGTFTNYRLDNIETTGTNLDSSDDGSFKGIQFVHNEPTSSFDYKVKVLDNLGNVPDSSKLKVETFEIKDISGLSIDKIITSDSVHTESVTFSDNYALEGVTNEIIPSYRDVTTEPDDWSTQYNKKYYIRTGTSPNYVYTKNTSSTWDSSKNYAEEICKAITPTAIQNVVIPTADTNNKILLSSSGKGVWSSSSLGSSTKGVYLNSSGVLTEGSTYAGGSRLNVNGSSYTQSATIYAPTTAGDSGKVLTSSGSGAPSWTTLYAPTTSGNSGQVLTSGGSGAPSWTTIYTLPSTGSTGQILVGGSSPSWLNAGTSGQVLTSGGSISNPSWATIYPPTSSGSSGQVLISGGSGSNPSWTSTGTSGQLLTSNGSNAPSWTTVYAPTSKGTSGQVWTSNGNDNPSWSTIYAPTTTGTSGQVWTSNGNNSPSWSTLYAPTSKGTLGQVWTSNGNDNPSWSVIYAPSTAGNSGQILTSGGSGNKPGWSTLYAPTTTGTSGQILVSSGSGNPTWLSSQGTSGQVLVSGGSGNNPSWETRKETKIFTQQTVSFVADSSYSGYGYKGTISNLTGVTSSSYANITFDLNQVLSGNYAPICETGSDCVYIYSKVNTQITIPSIMVVL